jgi:iron complex outermembrane receptor protein
VTGSGAHPGGQFNFSGGGRWCTLPAAFGGDEITNVWNQVDANGNRVCPSQALANSNAFPDAINAGNRYDYAFVQNILGGQNRWNVTGSGNYQLSDDVNLFAEFQFSDRESTSVLDGNPIFAGSGSVFFPGGWVVPAANPYNPFPGQSAQVTIRPTSTVGPRNQETSAQNFRIVAGLEGSILDDRFNWEVSLVETKTTSATTTDATFNLARAIRISNPTLCAADPLCTAALQPGSLGALDVYRPGNWSESEIAYIRQVATANFTQEQTAVNAFIAGEVFELPAGEVGVAVGLEYREEGLTFRPDAVTEAGESVANQTFSTFGNFDTYEAFAEVNVPLLKDAPLAKSLSLNLQGRVFDYSTFGSDTVYKAGLNWTPVEDIRLRATYGTSFRIPTLVDSFSGGTVGFQFITDPCDAGAINANATRLANCLAAGPLGVTAGFTQSAPQLAVLGGGDLADGTFDLGPEEGTTYTVGLVLTPSAVPGLNVSVDYYSIEVDNFISTTDVENEVLETCYDSVGLSDPTCQLFSRDALSRQLAGLVQTPINRATPLETAGIDWSLAYDFDVAGLLGQGGDMGSIAISHAGNYVTDYNLFPGIGNYGGSSGASAIPEYRLNFGVDWSFNDLRLSWDTRYTPELDDIAFDGRNFLGYDVVEEHWQNDVRIQYDTATNTRLMFGVNNVFDEEPPYAFSTGNNTIPGLYGSAIVGRYFFGRVTQSF